MQAKYYRYGSVLEAALGTQSSYVWRGLWGAKSLVQEGLLWRVGDGRSISVWEDPWVADDTTRFITTERGGSINKVSDLIDHNTMEWKWDVINEAFNERDRECIAKIALSLREPKDEQTWAFSKDGIYSVKSAYLLGNRCDLNNFHQALMDIWSMEVIPKVRHFLWRLCSNSLPVRTKLRSRHLVSEAPCPWCLEAEETSFHIFFKCSRVYGLWDDCECGSLRGSNPLQDWCEVEASWRKMEKKTVQRGTYLLWAIWMDRNAKVFRGMDTPNSITVSRVAKWVEEYGLYNTKIYARGEVPAIQKPSKQWRCPPTDVIKINTDPSLAEPDWVGLGVVARSHSGKVLFAATRRVKAQWDATMAEAKSVVFAMSLANTYDIKEVVFESDCQVVVNKIKKGVFHLTELDTILYEISSLCSYFTHAMWSHVGREGNAVTHHLARFIPFGSQQIWENHVLYDINPYVLMNSLTMNEN